MVRRILGAILLFCLATWVASCDAGRQPTPLTPLEQGEESWARDGVDDYRIVVVITSIWHRQRHDITVRDGQVTEATATCDPAPTELGRCQVQPFDAEDYTMPGLFARARSLTYSRDAQYGKIEFDATYGFPARMSYNHPDLIDEEWAWRVETFEVLE